MAKEILLQDGERLVTDLDATTWLPGLGSRLVLNVDYNLPTLDDATNGQAFYASQPENFSKEFYGIILNGAVKVPMGTFFRERTSAEGRIAGWDNQQTFTVAPCGAVADLFQQAIREGWSLSRLLANLRLRGSAIRATASLDVVVSYNKELKPRQVYRLEFSGTPDDRSVVTQWLNARTTANVPTADNSTV